MTELPLLDEPPRERADAARNRALVLQAAWRLYARGGVDALTADAVAQEAGVGKGTVFRRFKDKSGLVAALLDDKEKTLQQGILSGPPPLGPDAPLADRRLAFVRAYLDYMQEHLDLLLASETASAGARYRLGVYRFWKMHLTLLFADTYDPEFRAHAALALLDAGLVSHLLSEGWPWERIRAGIEAEVLQ